MITWVDNDIGVNGARMISESLKSNSTLTELNLRGDDNYNQNNTSMLKKKMKGA